MPARAKNPKILEFSGAYRKHPGRRPPTPRKRSRSAPGDAPGHLPKPEAEAWDELLALAPGGFLERSDRLHLELVCRLIVRTRSADARTTDFLALRLALRDAGLAPDTREKFAASVPSTDENREPSFADI